MNLREHTWLFLIYASALAGGIAGSQGFSFATWHEGDDVGDTLNEHAYLIGACGWGVFLCAEVVRRLLNRVKALEEELGRDRENRFKAFEEELRKGREMVNADQP